MDLKVNNQKFLPYRIFSEVWTKYINWLTKKCTSLNWQFFLKWISIGYKNVSWKTTKMISNVEDDVEISMSLELQVMFLVSIVVAIFRCLTIIEAEDLTFYMKHSTCLLTWKIWLDLLRCTRKLQMQM